MVGNELVLVSLAHSLQRVEGALQISSERVARFHYLLHDLKPLLLGHPRPQGVALQVAADSDSGGNDHGGFVLRQERARQLGGVHVGDVGVTLLVVMVVFNTLVHELGEGDVRIMGPSIGTNTCTKANFRIKVSEAPT